jgi:hypothetical protein
MSSRVAELYRKYSPHRQLQQRNTNAAKAASVPGAPNPWWGLPQCHFTASWTLNPRVRDYTDQSKVALSASLTPTPTAPPSSRQRPARRALARVAQAAAAPALPTPRRTPTPRSPAATTRMGPAPSAADRAAPGTSAGRATDTDTHTHALTHTQARTRAPPNAHTHAASACPEQETSLKHNGRQPVLSGMLAGTWDLVWPRRSRILLQ